MHLVSNARPDNLPSWDTPTPKSPCATRVWTIPPPIEADALADTDSLHLCLPEHLAIQLGLEEIDQREVTTADGKHHSVPYVRLIQITFGNRGCFGGAIVVGDQVLLGAVRMGDMDLVVSPPERRVMPNPLSPNIPTALAK